MQGPGRLDRIRQVQASLSQGRSRLDKIAEIQAGLREPEPATPRKVFPHEEPVEPEAEPDRGFFGTVGHYVGESVRHPVQTARGAARGVGASFGRTAEALTFGDYGEDVDRYYADMAERNAPTTEAETVGNVLGNIAGEGAQYIATGAAVRGLAGASRLAPALRARGLRGPAKAVRSLIKPKTFGARLAGDVAASLPMDAVVAAVGPENSTLGAIGSVVPPNLTAPGIGNVKDRLTALAANPATRLAGEMATGVVGDVGLSMVAGGARLTSRALKGPSLPDPVAARAGTTVLPDVDIPPVSDEVADRVREAMGVKRPERRKIDPGMGRDWNERRSGPFAEAAPIEVPEDVAIRVPKGKLKGPKPTEQKIRKGKVEGLEAMDEELYRIGLARDIESGLAEDRLARMGMEPPTTRALPGPDQAAGPRLRGPGEGPGADARSGAADPALVGALGRTGVGASAGAVLAPEGERAEGAVAGGLVGLAGPAALRSARRLGKAGHLVGPSRADLPMDEASRMARAKEQGFTTDAYHGTRAPEDFREFSTDGPPVDERLGYARDSGSGADPSAYMGAHFAIGPSVANKFAEGRGASWLKARAIEGGEAGGRVIPAKLRGKFKEFADDDELQSFIYQQPSTHPVVDDYLQDLGKYDDDAVEALGNRYDTEPEFREEVNRDVMDGLRASDGVDVEFAQDLGMRARDAIESEGYQGFRHKNTVEGGTAVGIFDPSNIRSRFAKFDPANIGKSDMLGGAPRPVVAALARTGVGALAGGAAASGEGGLTPAEGALAGAVALGAGPAVVRGLAGPGGVKALVGREFRVRGDLPELVFDAKRVKNAAVSAQETQIRFAARDLKSAAREAYGRAYDKLPEAEVSKINAVLKGEAGPETLPEGVRPAIEQMRAHVDALSAEMVRSGAVDGQLAVKIDGSMGTYLNRSYQVFDDPKWADKVPVPVRNRAKAFIRAEYPDADPEELEGLLNELLYRHAKADEGPIAALASGKLGSKSLGILKRRKDIPEPIRALWGEYNDPLVNYAKSVAKMSNIVANHRFLTTVREEGLGSFFHESPIVKDGVSYHEQIAADVSKPMAPLNGLYTSPEVARAFEEALDPQALGPWMRYYMKVNTAVKGGKTVGSVVTQVRNLLSNPMIELANGNPRFWNVPKAVAAVGSQVSGATESVVKRLAGVVGSDTDWRKYYTDLQRLGVVDESANAGELRDMVRDAGLREGRIEDAFADPSSGLGRKAIQAAGDVYRANDDLFKVFAFEGEIARYRNALPDMPEDELRKLVAGIVTDTRPTYSKVPKITKRFRRFPLVGNFVSFPSEIMRTSYNTLKLAVSEMADPKLRGIGAQRMAGIVAAGTVVGGAAAYSRFAMGVSKDDDDDLRKFVPPWTRNANLLHLGRGENGNWRYIDLSYTDPYSYLRKPVVALMRGEDWEAAMKDSAVEFFSPFLSEEILASTLVNVRSNQRDGQGTSRIYNPEDSGAKQLQDIVGYVATRVQPGTITSLQRIEGGLSGKMTSSGRTYDAKTEALAMMTGQRVGDINVTQGLFFRALDLENRMRDANRTFTAALGDLSASPDVGAAYTSAHGLRQEIFEEATETTRAAERLGVSGKAIVSALKQAGLSEANIAAIRDGKTPFYTPSEQYLNGLLDKMLSAGIPRAEAVSTIKRRVAAARATVPQLQRAGVRD